MMSIGLLSGFVLALIVTCSATATRADPMNVICSNMDALNADFVMLLARHLDFEPNVLLNPSRQQVVNLGTLAAVRFVVSGNDFNSILECGDRIGVDANRLEQEVFRLRSRLSSEAVLAYTGEPTGRVVTAGEELEISGQHIFVSVSDIDDLMAAGSAVAYLHGANHLSCWFDPACSAEAEAHWAGRSD